MHHFRRTFSLRFASFAFAALLLAAASPQVRAATVLALDLPALVKQSDYIVLANAQAESSRYRSQDRLIVTDVELRVIESLKGDAKVGGTVVATRLGGTVDRIGLTVPGEASFAIGKSALVFLRKATSAKELYVVGMSQGVLPIDGEGGSARVLPGGAGSALVQRQDNGKLAPAPDALLTPQPLRDVLARIAQLVAGDHAR
ncbi:MAG TPA: hypothetical protein VHM19_02420 [Polyangiales bacterium]|jgi:hypothetical protein|nr:hypothetical protein [Polyangiales bacterium]